MLWSNRSENTPSTISSAEVLTCPASVLSEHLYIPSSSSTDLEIDSLLLVALVVIWMRSLSRTCFMPLNHCTVGFRSLTNSVSMVTGSPSSTSTSSSSLVICRDFGLVVWTLGFSLTLGGPSNSSRGIDNCTGSFDVAGGISSAMGEPFSGGDVDLFSDVSVPWPSSFVSDGPNNSSRGTENCTGLSAARAVSSYDSLSCGVPSDGPSNSFRGIWNRTDSSCTGVISSVEGDSSDVAGAFPSCSSPAVSTTLSSSGESSNSSMGRLTWTGWKLKEVAVGSCSPFAGTRNSTSPKGTPLTEGMVKRTSPNTVVPCPLACSSVGSESVSSDSLKIQKIKYSASKYV